jgi:hypothetical protein
MACVTLTSRRRSGLRTTADPVRTDLQTAASAGTTGAYCELDDVWSSDLVMSQGRPECGDGLRGESPSRARP